MFLLLILLSLYYNIASLTITTVAIHVPHNFASAVWQVSSCVHIAIYFSIYQSTLFTLSFDPFY